MSQTALTYRDYEALPNDGSRYEIHDGELSVTPAPTPQHQIVSRRGIEGAPTPAVEILSPSRKGDRYILAAGPGPVDLPPFTGLDLIPESL
jgi:hypothetical protein